MDEESKSSERKAIRCVKLLKKICNQDKSKHFLKQGITFDYTNPETEYPEVLENLRTSCMSNVISITLLNTVRTYREIGELRSNKNPNIEQWASKLRKLVVDVNPDRWPNNFDVGAIEAGLIKTVEEIEFVSPKNKPLPAEMVNIIATIAKSNPKSMKLSFSVHKSANTKAIANAIASNKNLKTFSDVYSTIDKELLPKKFRGQGK